MKQFILTLLLTALFCGVIFANPATPPFENPIRIAHPAENARLPALDSTFVFGAAPPEGKLFINGVPAPIHPEGGFLTMVKLTPGEFQINAELELDGNKYRFTRTIFVAGPEKPAPATPLTIEYVAPSQDQQLLPGDYLEVVCKGSPGKSGYFTIKGVKGKFPLTETANAPGGIYHGVYRISNNDRLRQAKIKVTLIDEKRHKISKEAAGAVSLFPENPPVMAEVISANAVLRSGPALTLDDKAGYLMFPPQGTILRLTGSKGNEYRVRLTKTKSAWVDQNQVKPLPEGTQPNNIVAGNISLDTAPNSTLIRIPMGRKIPYHIEPDTEGNFIDISFFGAFSNTDWITDAAGGKIKQIRWFQDDEETYRLRIFTVPNGWWGYDARYEGNQFVLELKSPPPVSAAGSPLAGLTIAIDPGHSADTGAVGPTGLAEKDANLAIAVNLKEKLTAKGVKVIMTRSGNENVSLNERPLIAQRYKADILISIHNNALGYGQNPFIKRGFGVYYYTPMSLPLAKEIHRAYAETFSSSKEFTLRDDGLYYANLALARASQMPSVLIESAYMIVPEEEAYLKRESFRSACANAIITGIERYVQTMRPKTPVN
ncbi:MAG: N-acetylmuramoyl-L-alanine amidase [Bacteroidota bacterium]